jgi:hypothetical protein
VQPTALEENVPKLMALAPVLMDSTQLTVLNHVHLTVLEANVPKLMELAPVTMASTAPTAQNPVHIVHLKNVPNLTDHAPNVNMDGLVPTVTLNAKQVATVEKMNVINILVIAPKAVTLELGARLVKINALPTVNMLIMNVY